MLTTFSGTVGGQLRQVLLYMVMSRDQITGRSHNIKTDNSPCGWVEQCRYLGKALTNKNSMQGKN
jgi:hypothetical protein